MMEFFANPAEGADFSLKWVESKIEQHFYFKNFSKYETFILNQKIPSQN